MKSIFIAIALMITVLVGAGCARRVVVVQPPPPRVEIVPVAPSPRHVWVKGHYVKRGRNYVWVGGRYVNRRGRY